MSNSVDVSIRACGERDIPAVTAIYEHAVIHGTASFELEPPSVDEMRARHRSLLENGYPYLVAVHGEDIAGYAYASAYRSRPAYRATVEDSVYIREDLQGQGIGRALLERLITDCTRPHYRQMIAVIGDYGNLGSIRLHERLGFEHAGVFRAIGWKHGRWLDTVLMQRALGNGATGPLI